MGLQIYFHPHKNTKPDFHTQLHKIENVELFLSTVYRKYCTIFYTIIQQHSKSELN